MERRAVKRLIAGALVALLAGSQLAAHAAGLQVAPISVALEPARQSASLWLDNSSDAAMDVQVRVFDWSQPDGQDKLEPSRQLVVSPPMARLAPGQRQLVRVMRVGPPPSGPDAVQKAFRLVVDELPREEAAGQGVKFLMRYSVPVFVNPTGSVGAPVASKLNWSAAQSPQGLKLDVRNDGAGHAQLAQLTFVDTQGKKKQLNAGLMGYVLPGATRQWDLSSAPKQAGHLEVLVNGELKVVEIRS